VEKNTKNATTPIKFMKIKQLNIDCYECRGDLNSPALVGIMKSAANKCGAKVIGSAFQKYKKYGITAVVFLAESHILVSTYPEIQFAVVEIFLCNDKVDANVCWEEIKRYIRPKKIIMGEFYHDIRKKI